MPDEHQPDQAEEAARAAAGSPEPPELAEPTRAADSEPVGPAAGPAGDLPAVPPAGPADPMVAVPPAADSGAPDPKAAPKKRGRPPGSKNKPKPPPATVPADPGAGGEPLPQAPVAPEPEQQPQQQARHPVRMTPSQERRISRQNRFEQLAVAASMDV